MGSLVCQGFFRTQWFLPDRKLPKRAIQTTGDLAEELSTDKGGGFPGIFPDIHTVHALKNPVEIAIRFGRQGMDIVIRHDDPQRQFTPGNLCADPRRSFLQAIWLLAALCRAGNLSLSRLRRSAQRLCPLLKVPIIYGNVGSLLQPFVQFTFKYDGIAMAGKYFHFHNAASRRSDVKRSMDRNVL